MLQNIWVPVMCYSLATSFWRPDSNIALVMVINSLIADEINGNGSTSFQDQVKQTPCLGLAVPCYPQSCGIIYASLKIILSAAEC